MKNYTIIAIDYYLQLVEKGMLKSTAKEQALEFLKARLQSLMEPKEYEMTSDIIKRMGEI